MTAAITPWVRGVNTAREFTYSGLSEILRSPYDQENAMVSLQFVLGAIFAFTVAQIVVWAYFAWDRWYYRGYHEARAHARATYEEYMQEAGRRARNVMATLDMLDAEWAGHLVEELGGETGIPATGIPFHAAYRYSRQVRARMCYPVRSRANMLVASDHLRTLITENNVRPTVAASLLPLALEMVFIRDKRELEAATVAQMMRGTWREARELAA